MPLGTLTSEALNFALQLKLTLERRSAQRIHQWTTTEASAVFTAKPRRFVCEEHRPYPHRHGPLGEDRLPNDGGFHVGLCD